MAVTTSLTDVEAAIVQTGTAAPADQSIICFPLAEVSDEALQQIHKSALRVYALANDRAALKAKNGALVGLNGELEAKVSRRTQELAHANTKLARLSVTDGLTSLFSHRQFIDRLPLEIERSLRSGLPLSVLLVDVDAFRHFNTAHGYRAGDEVLRELAALLYDGQRANDYCCRYGGDELAVVLVDTPKLTADKVAARILSRVRDMKQFPEPVTISIGVASFPDDAANAEDLIAAVERATNKAGSEGGNCVVLA